MSIDRMPSSLGIQDPDWHQYRRRAAMEARGEATASQGIKEPHRQGEERRTAGLVVKAAPTRPNLQGGPPPHDPHRIITVKAPPPNWLHRCSMLVDTEEKRVAAIKRQEEQLKQQRTDESKDEGNEASKPRGSESAVQYYRRVVPHLELSQSEWAEAFW